MYACNGKKDFCRIIVAIARVNYNRKSELVHVRDVSLMCVCVVLARRQTNVSTCETLRVRTESVFYAYVVCGI